MNKETISEDDLSGWRLIKELKNGRTQLLGKANQRIVLDTKDNSIVYRCYGTYHIPPQKIKKGSFKKSTPFFYFKFYDLIILHLLTLFYVSN